MLVRGPICCPKLNESVTKRSSSVKLDFFFGFGTSYNVTRSFGKTLFITVSLSDVNKISKSIFQKSEPA